MIERLVMMALLFVLAWRCIAPATPHTNPLRNLSPEQREEVLSMDKVARRCLCSVQPCLRHMTEAGPNEQQLFAVLTDTRSFLARIRAEHVLAIVPATSVASSTRCTG